VRRVAAKPLKWCNVATPMHNSTRVVWAGGTMVKRMAGAGLLLFTPCLGAGCVDGDDDPDDETCKQKLSSSNGALVDVELTSRVAVVLDEIPEAEREELARFYLRQPSAFWLERAKHQLRHTTYRLTYRNFYYDESEQRQMLALPPEDVWHIRLDGKPERVTTEDGHDAVEVGYDFKSTIVTDADSPGASDPALGEVGGVWVEPFNLPLDPEFLFQRTGYACANEEGYPLGTVGGENIFQMFDQDCDVEAENTAACHLTNLPDESCLDALSNHVGRVDSELRFERATFSPAKACSATVGTFTSEEPDLAVVADALDNNWVEYRYFPPDSCALVEQCVGGTGWRRLLLFDATIKNTGLAPLSVGSTNEGSPPRDHNMFEFSACHEHFHFRHYGDFSYGDSPGDKRAFCIESTERHYNNVASPLVHDFGCENQGVAPGWGDTYIAGVECNWIDITDVDMPASNPSLSARVAAGIKQDLKFVLNPDDFICEGEPQLSESGEPLYEATDYVTETGDTVDRPVCDFVSGYDSNNVGRRSVSLSPEGSIVTSACKREQAGPLRDCGFDKQQDHIDCEPGTEIELSCSVGEGEASQVLRVCDDSVKLGGIPCMYRHALANTVVGSEATAVSFVCPDPHDADEPGGSYSLYVAAVNPKKPGASVACTALR
jgi:hypothetical protein